MRNLRILAPACFAVLAAGLGASSAQTAGGPAQASTHAQTESGPKEQKEWIKRSNEFAQILIKVQAKYAPEFAARQGVQGLDDQISQFSTNRREQQKADTRAALEQLRKALAAEKDPLVKQDLQIMIKAAEQALHGQELGEKFDMPYFNVSQLVFGGLRGLLDDQVPQERRKYALVRLRKYAGWEQGYAPITDQAKARSIEWRKPGQLGPAKVEVETDLAR